MEVQSVNARRRVLNHTVYNILFETGFEACDKPAVETLTEMLQSCKEHSFKQTNYFLTFQLAKFYKTFVHFQILPKLENRQEITVNCRVEQSQS